MDKHPEADSFRAAWDAALDLGVRRIEDAAMDRALYGTEETIHYHGEHVATREQVHIIKDELGKLGKDFQRFDARMRKLADHIRLAHQDAEDVRVSSDKITRRFTQIERVELDQPDQLRNLDQALLDVEPADEPGGEEPRT